jgi:hypothetical protein
MTVRQANVIAAALLTCMGLLFVVLSIPIYEKRIGAGPGAGVFPMWVGLMLTACAIAYLVDSIRKAAPQRFSATKSEERGWLVWTLASLFGYVGLMPYLGFALATFLFTTIQLRVIGGYRWVFSLVFSLATAVLCTYIFRVGLYMGLPRGFLGW